MAELLLLATTKRDKAGVKKINQEMKNLAHYFNSRLFVQKKESEEDFEKVWEKIRSMARKEL